MHSVSRIQQQADKITTSPACTPCFSLIIKDTPPWWQHKYGTLVPLNVIYSDLDLIQGHSYLTEGYVVWLPRTIGMPSVTSVCIKLKGREMTIFSACAINLLLYLPLPLPPPVPHTPWLQAGEKLKHIWPERKADEKNRKSSIPVFFMLNTFSCWHILSCPNWLQVHHHTCNGCSILPSAVWLCHTTQCFAWVQYCSVLGVCAYFCCYNCYLCWYCWVFFIVFLVDSQLLFLEFYLHSTVCCIITYRSAFYSRI